MLDIPVEAIRLDTQTAILEDAVLAEGIVVDIEEFDPFLIILSDGVVRHQVGPSKVVDKDTRAIVPHNQVASVGRCSADDDGIGFRFNAAPTVRDEA